MQPENLLRSPLRGTVAATPLATESENPSANDIIVTAFHNHDGTSIVARHCSSDPIDDSSQAFSNESGRQTLDTTDVDHLHQPLRVVTSQAGKHWTRQMFAICISHCEALR